MTPMAPTLAMFDGPKKFMWDGSVYETREDASFAQRRYLEDRFEVRLVQADTRFLLYTRRVASPSMARHGQT